MGNGALARESRITTLQVIPELERGGASNQAARAPRGSVRPLACRARGLPDAHSLGRRLVEVHNSEAFGSCAG
jgi:hypothetical protein